MSYYSLDFRLSKSQKTEFHTDTSTWHETHQFQPHMLTSEVKRLIKTRIPINLSIISFINASQKMSTRYLSFYLVFDSFKVKRIGLYCFIHLVVLSKKTRCVTYDAIQCSERGTDHPGHFFFLFSLKLSYISQYTNFLFLDFKIWSFNHDLPTNIYSWTFLFSLHRC